MLGARGDERETTPDVVLHMELGRLYQLVEKYAKSADHFARVVYALDHEEEFKLDAKTKQALLSPPAPTYLLFAESFLRAGRAKKRWPPSKRPTGWRPQGAAGLSPGGSRSRDGKADAALANLQLYFDLRRTVAGLAPYRLLREILKRQGKSDELPERLEKIGAATRATWRLLLSLADQYREKARFDKAEPLYRLLVKQTPLMMPGYRGLLEIYRKSKRPEALLSAIAQAAGGGAASIRWTARSAASATTNRCWTRSSLWPAIASRRMQERMDYGTRLAVALLASEAKRFDVAGNFFQRAVQLHQRKARKSCWPRAQPARPGSRGGRRQGPQAGHRHESGGEPGRL